MTFILFLAGIASMVVGAELMVRGASRLAAAFGVSPLVIGLTVVAFGTSAPELAVGIQAARAGEAGITIGNIVGSNIFSVLVILGLSALVSPLAVSQRLVRLDVPLMIGLSMLVLLLSLDGRTSRIEGSALVASLVVYVGYRLYQSRRETRAIHSQYKREFGRPRGAGRKWLHLIWVTAGLVLLAVGSNWLVDAAVLIARYLGVSDSIVALTIVAAGTSLPEVAASVIATIRGARDIAVGNVVGSNLFNLMGVLGVAGIVAPEEIQISRAVLAFDMPIMVVVAFACLPIFFTGGAINRLEGSVLLAYYAAYVLYLMGAATHHDALPGFSAVMLYFAIPLTLLTLFVLAFGELGRPRGG